VSWQLHCSAVAFVK